VGNLFASRGNPDSVTKEEDDQRARMSLGYVLCCDVLSASIPGLITVDQVRSATAAVRERREFEAAEAARYQELAAEMWRNLPVNYQWLHDWKRV
jgi:aryl-alcohol dehydrogenase-like predicted oxidoreductase